MFVDRVEIEVRAGRGGDGVIAWRKEKYIPKGGPAGGDGGCGGSVYISVDPNVAGLESFRYQRLCVAGDGQKGGKSCASGKAGDDLILKIPPGTVVRDAMTQDILFDGVVAHTQCTLCQGGKGGKGNARFKSSTNRAPRIATKGTVGQEARVELELKLIGDVGLVGFPNAGKSTLLTALTHTIVPTGAYPFTTLAPNIGFLSTHDGARIIVTDIPGIIEGAHRNKGLGLEFLRHIERTKILLFVIDSAGVDGRNPLEDFTILQQELAAYDPQLLKRPSCVVLNKCDVPESVEWIETFTKTISLPLFVVSAAEHINMESLIAYIEELMKKCSYDAWKNLPPEDKRPLIEDCIATYITPQLALDGGGITVVDIQDMMVTIRYTGACCGCPAAASGTLFFIQETLQRYLHPELHIQLCSD